MRVVLDSNILARAAHNPAALHGFSHDEILRFVERIANSSFIVTSQVVAQPVVAVDPDDDAIVATAIAGHADVVCTLDRHIRAVSVAEYCKQSGIEIMTDVELLDRLKALP